MRRFVAPLIAALCLPAAAMAAAPVANEGLARIEMQVETGFLSAEERQVVNLLIQAADEMTAIYKRQAAGPGPGHGLYPDGLTKAELDAYIAAHPDRKAALMDGYTVVKRQGDKLVTTPYSVEYKAELDRAAADCEPHRGDAVVLEAERARRQGEAMASDPAVVALCEKQLVGFLRHFLQQQPGVQVVPQISIVYR